MRTYLFGLIALALLVNRPLFGESPTAACNAPGGLRRDRDVQRRPPAASPRRARTDNLRRHGGLRGRLGVQWLRQLLPPLRLPPDARLPRVLHNEASRQARLHLQVRRRLLSSLQLLLQGMRLLRRPLLRSRGEPAGDPPRGRGTPGPQVHRGVGLPELWCVRRAVPIERGSRQRRRSRPPRTC